ncbi:hypothetical protein [Klebsiella aerogenes]|uniref:hypothetical protein n=1 Tax=Klebsiella aerogenes TaxID=548 RepID=UPI001BCD660B|nr:hypothetical protein [Klebsiella aerogenes]
MTDEDNNSENKLREEVLQKLRDTLNQHRQIAEEDDYSSSAECTQPKPEHSKPKNTHKHTAGRLTFRPGRDRANSGYKTANSARVRELARSVSREVAGGNVSLPYQVKTTQVSALDPEEHRKQLNNRDFKAEIKLKKSYGKWFLIILAVQLAVMNLVFIADGLKWLNFEALTLQLYMGGTLTEVFGLVLVVTKYLFKRK